jgi:phosphoribosylglycinamide formyltransferase-1
MVLKKIAVLVSGGGTNLQARIDTLHGKYCEITCVVSDVPDAYALQRAKAAGIAAKAFDYKGYANKDDFYGDMLRYIGQMRPELIVMAGFLKILPENFYSTYKNRIINIHPSLIPSFCGKGYYGIRVHQAALDYGVKVTGATVHFADGGADTGPIILQKAVSVLSNDTPQTLQQRVLAVEHELLAKAVRLFVEDKISIQGRIVTINETSEDEK